MKSVVDEPAVAADEVELVARDRKPVMAGPVTRERPDASLVRAPARAGDQEKIVRNGK
jgi:hypothetical protein